MVALINIQIGGCVYLMLDNTVVMELRKVQSYLGHARVNTTQRYTHHSNEEVVSAFFKARDGDAVLA